MAHVPTLDLVSQSDNEVRGDPHLSTLLDAFCLKNGLVVIAGSGISTSAGIPTFRTKDGLFVQLKQTYRLKCSGEDLFSADVFKFPDRAAAFLDMIRQLYGQCKEAEPTPFHLLLQSIAREGRLLRLYTQNIDGLDTRLKELSTTVPLTATNNAWPLTIQLHGSVEFMQCEKCTSVVSLSPWAHGEDDLPNCTGDCAQDRRRHDMRIQLRPAVPGRLRPRISLYNEEPYDSQAISRVIDHDTNILSPGPVIVVGTTLKVPGACQLVRNLAKKAKANGSPVIWIAPDRPSSNLKGLFTLIVLAQADTIAAKVLARTAKTAWDIHSLLDWRQNPDDLERMQILVRWPPVGGEEYAPSYAEEDAIQEGSPELLYQFWSDRGGRTEAIIQKYPSLNGRLMFHVFKIRDQIQSRYQVQWVGYSDQEMTWESAEYMHQVAPECVLAYQEKRNI
ncbi:Uu.00g130350.m01.CDS01 [Anthostomella pinea]|uniref:Uu.00g130350.m01.CDS01 n=1 Tax=Anthostomella pinea TaxID=933095 RepID=A0AAI8YI65_9PEZI|nr:Uu.00g130350.m01.CDS01 [Anthostomella pinea]